MSAVDDKGTIKRAKVSKAGETGHRKETVWIYYWRVAHTLISYVSDSYSERTLFILFPGERGREGAEELQATGCVNCD